MKIEFRLVTAFIAVVLISAAIAEGARSRPLDEDAALALLERTLKQRPRLRKANLIGLHCVWHRRDDERLF